MPEITTSLRTPNYASAPSSPVKGNVYFDTTTNSLYFYDGTNWRSTSPEVYTGTSAPSPRGDYEIWIDTT